MKAALVTPVLRHLPLYPGFHLGYGAAVLEKRFELDVLDLNAEIYYRNRDRFKELLSHLDRKGVINDHLDLDPFYHELLKETDNLYAEVPWRRYACVFVTIPSWFVNVPTTSILRLAHAVRSEAPSIKVFFFGNSLGTWTDENELKNNDIQIVHLNALLEPDSNPHPVDFDALPTPLYTDRKKYMFDILPFRLKHGCPWGRCGFCSLAKGWNTGYMERSSARVVEEIEEMNTRYDPAMFVCNDNSITGNNLLEVCRRLEGLGKPWGAMSRADLTEEEIAALRKAGCVVLYFGLESGSDRVLKEINKGVTSDEISVFIRNLSGADIMPAPSVFVGAPGERKEDFEQTVRFVTDHKDCFDTINLYPLSMTPSSHFTTTDRETHRDVLARLFYLMSICAQLGMKVCVGEQSGEYAVGRAAHPCGAIYRE